MKYPPRTTSQCLVIFSPPVVFIMAEYNAVSDSSSRRISTVLSRSPEIMMRPPETIGVVSFFHTNLSLVWCECSPSNVTHSPLFLISVLLIEITSSAVKKNTTE